MSKGVKKGWRITKVIGKDLVKVVKGEEEKKDEKKKCKLANARGICF